MPVGQRPWSGRPFQIAVEERPCQRRWSARDLELERDLEAVAGGDGRVPEANRSLLGPGASRQTKAHKKRKNQPCETSLRNHVWKAFKLVECVESTQRSTEWTATTRRSRC